MPVDTADAISDSDACGIGWRAGNHRFDIGGEILKRISGDANGVVCLDKKTGAKLQLQINGAGRFQSVEATAFAEPTDSDFQPPAPPEGTQTLVDETLVPSVAWSFPLSLTLKSAEERGFVTDGKSKSGAKGGKPADPKNNAKGAAKPEAQKPEAAKPAPAGEAKK